MSFCQQLEDAMCEEPIELTNEEHAIDDPTQQAIESPFQGWMVDQNNNEGHVSTSEMTLSSNEAYPTYAPHTTRP